MKLRVRKTPEQDLEETRAELAGARKQSARWQARVTELEEQVTEKENLLILRAVRSVAASPEELRGLLDMIRDAKNFSAVMAAPPVPEPPDNPDITPDAITDATPGMTDASPNTTPDFITDETDGYPPDDEEELGNEE